MKYLPSENSVYKSKLKETELVNRLSEIIEPERTFRLGSSSSKPYEGKIDDLTFNMRRIITYKNSFLPRINGVIHSGFDGTTITVKMRLPIFVIIFICIWCSGVLLGCVAVLAPLLVDGEFHPATLIPFGMFVFMYALTMAGFKYESKKSKKDLQTLFEAEIETQP